MSNHSRQIAVNGNQQSLRFRDKSVNNPQAARGVSWYRILTIVFLVFATAAWAQTSPTVSSISPTVGPPSPVGSSVTIQGSNFGTVQGNSSVTFAGIAATPSSWSDGTIVVPVPSSLGAGFADVVVTVNGSPSNAQSFLAIPVITGISPNPAPVGASVTVTGAGFGTVASSLTFNGTDATATSWAGASIAAPVPGGATTGDVVVTVNGFTTNAAPFTVGGQTPPPPTITSVSPTSGSSGTIVNISGANFGDSQGTNEVVLGGLGADAPPSIASWSDTAITLTVPDTATSGPLLVIVNDQVSNGIDFIVPPVVNTLTPASGVSGTVITINGTNFGALQGSSTVSVDGVTAVPATWSATAISFPVPTGASTGDVVVSVNSIPSNALTFVFNPTNGIVTSFRYDSQGQLISITDPLNHTTSFTYTNSGTTPAGLLQTTTDALNNVTQYQYDVAGNRSALLDPLQNQTAFVYDLRNRLTGITYPDSAAVSFGYDSRGRRTSVTDQNRNVTNYAFDDADRLTSVTDAANNMTSYGYDTENNLTNITDANNHTTSFSYDAFGRVTQTLFPSTLAESYIYDAVGNLTSKTDRKNQTITYAYDALNRLISKQYPDTTSVTYVYDLAGQLKQVSDSKGTYGLAYDNMGRLIETSTQYSFLPVNPYVNSYTYDAASNRTGFIAPDGSTTAYVYDTLNRVSMLTNSLTGQFGFTYDALSRRTALNRPNGVNTSYNYDNLSRLLSVLHHSGATTVDGAGYTYDKVGNRTSKSNYLNNITESYGYDLVYRLTQVTQGTMTTESYSYDGLGNRLSSLSMPSYTYNSSNQLTSTSSVTFMYDPNGNTLSKTDGSGTTTYTWDFEDRLTLVTLPGSSGTVSFIYDPFGRRIQKSSSNGTTNYLYDGANVIQEVDQSGNVLARYSQDSEIDRPLAEVRSGATSFYHQDGLGSVTSLSQSSGTLANTYRFDTFGNLTLSTGAIVNPFRFSGREFDTETGLGYYRARYYDPQIGRFLSEDPKRFVSGVNFYSYVKNNSPNLVDPFGFAGSHPASIDLAWNEARLLLSDPNCAKFLKDLFVSLHNLPNLDLFLENFDNTNFGFTPKNDPYIGNRKDWGIAHVDSITLSTSNRTVHINPIATGSQNASILAVTMLHEVLHTYPYAFTDFDIAVAVGYKGSPKDGIKPASNFFSNVMEEHCKVNCGKK